MSSDLIVVSGLEKLFRIGFTRRRVHAVRGVSFEVAEGDIFGFLGPNGAGKTTTIKMLMGLISPTAGSAKLFGHEIPSSVARARIGFLPENPYIYPFLTPREFVELCGRLSGLRGRKLREASEHALERTGVLYAADRPVKRLSKGMQQRAALGAALVADPDLLILDEPMSGLDPVGRKQVKDLIVEEQRKGKTIFFSTHILGDVETLCDRVVIMRQGKIVVEGKLDELLAKESQRVGVVLSGAPDDFVATCQGEGLEVSLAGGRLRLELEGRSQAQEILQRAMNAGAKIEEVAPRHETLEDLFVREAIAPPDASREGLTSG